MIKLTGGTMKINIFGFIWGVVFGLIFRSLGGESVKCWEFWVGLILPVIGVCIIKTLTEEEYETK